ncbi:homoserine kinase [Cellulomonas triticagri]|uniref:Homoserine kinase n=1 Tax=Cellulomonas triticagri TaxID=2483352 RepID=A0A3M2J4U9_9CELL|nr:homoserine kinase [Cellulomonas triticagri]RMI06940.1 homoserine kinase [Cellulomonas triticagri]
MRLGADRARVRVPATSANLGPGFDALGLALALHDDVEVRALGSAEVVVDVVGEGAGEVPSGEDHLVVRALRHGLDHVGAPQTGLHLTCRNRIPHGRGLGSSAAAVVAGLLAARALVAEPEWLDDDVVLRLATELEGHPDNAAPALLGGATVAWTDAGAGTAHAARLPVHETLLPIAVVPTTRLSTSHARGVLPAQVPHGDAAFQAGRAALLVEALGRRPDLLLPATLDRLHQDYRRSVMPESLALVDALRALDVPAVVSGAGPTVLVLGRAAGEIADAATAPTDADRALDQVFGGAMGGWRIVRPGIDATGATWRRLP